MKEIIKKTIYFPYLLLKKARKALSFWFMDRSLALWYENPKQKTLRFDYDLNENSIVFDLGGYEGQWASDIFSMYICHVYVFEPVKEFSGNIKNRFSRNSKIKVCDFGLGGDTREENISLSADGSSVFRVGEGIKEKINIVDIVDFISDQKIKKIDLIKINIEGGEYELLERLINADFIKNIQNIQVQFHNIEKNSKERMLAIQVELAKTHKTTYQYEFVWENWTLR